MLVIDDQKQLELLRELLLSQQYVDAIKNLDKDVDWLQRYRAELLQTPTLTEHEKDIVQAYESEFFDPEKAFQGKLITQLASMARELVPQHSDLLSEIPVCLLPTDQVNACIVALPSGKPAIFIDFNAICFLPRFCREFWALCSWNTREPYCRDHTAGEFAVGVINIATYVATGNTYMLNKFEYLECPSLPNLDDLMSYFTSEVVVFMLLHEYGHHMLGHISKSSAIYVSPRHTSSKISINRNSIDDEFKADEYAIRSMIDDLDNDPLQVAFGAGIFFSLLHLSEMFQNTDDRLENRTHPPAMDRWIRVKELCTLSKYPDSPVWLIDQAIETIEQTVARVRDKKHE